MAVEGPVHPALNSALEGVEDGGRDQNGDDQAPLPDRFRHGIVNHDGDQRDGTEVAAEDQAGGQRVGHAALEDQVSVHEPVADDGPTEGEGENDQRKTGQIGEQPGRVQVEKEGNGIKQRKGQHRQQCAAGNPLQLLA